MGWRWLLVLFLLPASAAAQTSVCGDPPLTTVDVGQTVTLCWEPVTKDLSGRDTTITATRLYRNGVLLGGKTIKVDTSGPLTWHTTTVTEPAPATMVRYDVAVVDDVGRESPKTSFLLLSVLPVRTGPTAPAQFKAVARPVP